MIDGWRASCLQCNRSYSHNLHKASWGVRRRWFVQFTNPTYCMSNSNSEDFANPTANYPHAPDRGQRWGARRKNAAMLSLYVHDNYNYNEGQSIK